MLTTSTSTEEERSPDASSSGEARLVGLLVRNSPYERRLLKLAKDAQFGRSSEKLETDQLQLVLEDID